MQNGERVQLRGTYRTDAYAEYLMQQRRQGLARLQQRPRERQHYYQAMDRLFIEAEEVNTNLIEFTVIENHRASKG